MQAQSTPSNQPKAPRRGFTLPPALVARVDAQAGIDKRTRANWVAVVVEEAVERAEARQRKAAKQDPQMRLGIGAAQPIHPEAA